MKGFILSLRSEFYKSRKTMGFWCSVLLPFILCLFMFIGFLANSTHAAKMPGAPLWAFYSGLILGTMGLFLLPIYLILIGYSVNSIEHKADTWKSLFSLPISKWSIYAAKYTYTVFLVFMCLTLFYVFTISSGNLLGILKPELKFSEFHMESYLGQVYLKLFLASLGILSIQFLLSLIWSDFLKPMGIGFLCTIVGDILANIGWQYSYWVPYAHPLLALKNMGNHSSPRNAAVPTLSVNMFTNDIYVSIGVAVVFFILGFYIVQKKSVK